MQTQFFEIYRAGLKSAADMMTATLESARRLQQQQLDTLQSAIDDQTKSVRELADVRTVDELMALQTRLAGSQMERTMDLWSRLWRAAGDNQLAMIGQAQSQLGQVREGLRDVTREAAQQAGEAHQEQQRAA
jgi:phasin family protein